MLGLQAFERKWKDCLQGLEYVLQQRAPVSCCKFWWEAGHGGHLQQLSLKRGDQKEAYVMKDQEVLETTGQQNLIHMELTYIHAYIHT
jgi:hypothetical protein